jgi:glycosyltransferase involved in cell wall biosynthesis
VSIEFSVAMATYNGERFLQEQLDSIARQTLLPIELVVGDDGSTDATVSILCAFQRRAPFDVRIVVNDDNLGYGETFLRAAALARADWIAFCDQDDVWFTHKLQSFARAIDSLPGVGLLSHSAIQVNENLAPLPFRVPNHSRFRVRRNLQSQPLSVLPGFTCCVRKALLQSVPAETRPEEIGRPGRKQAHDSFIYHLANSYGHIAYLPEPLALYRRHAAALTGNLPGGAHDRSLRTRVSGARYSHKDGYLLVAEQARQHADYYARMAATSERCAVDAEFLRRTDDASAYYRGIAHAYSIRARIHDNVATFGQRLSALWSLLASGAYSSISGVGIGLGSRALVKDIVRVFVHWKA